MDSQQHLDDIPAFLRISAEERAAAWKGRRLTQMRKSEAKADYNMPRSADATARALAKERELQRQAKANARLAALNQKRKVMPVASSADQTRTTKRDHDTRPPRATGADRF